MRKKGFLSVAAVLCAVSASFFSTNVTHAGTQTCTWTGGGSNSNWSTAANWSCDTGTVPADGGALVFPYGTPGTVSFYGSEPGSNNDLSATNTYTSLSFTKTTSCGYGYYITGNLLKLAGNITTALDCSANIVAAMSLSSDVTVNAGAGFYFGDSASSSTYPISLNGHTLTYNGTSSSVWTSRISGPITGSGNLVIVNQRLMLSGNNTFSGTISAASRGSVVADYRNGATTTPFGNSSNQINIGDQGTLAVTEESLSNAVTVAIPQAVTITGSAYAGSSRIQVGTFISPTFNYSFTPSSFYEINHTNSSVIFTGNLTIPSNITIAAGWASTKFTGSIMGAYTIAPDTTLYNSIATGDIVLASSSNGSLTANGTYNNPNVPATLTDSLPSDNIAIFSGYTVIVNGQRGCVGVQDGGILKGSGSVGCIESKGGIVAPGNSPGTLNSGNVTLDSASTYQAELGGTSAGQYDQLNVTGTVSLGGATLATSLYNSYAPALNSTYTIINNDGTDAVTGTFAGLAQGASFTVGGYTFTISYTGGDGNDVVLTVTTVPSAPNTGGVLAKPVNILLGASVVLAGVGVLIVRKIMLRKVARAQQ